MDLIFSKKQNPGTDAARKVLFINKISVFRVDGIATLKTLKLLRQSLLLAAPTTYCSISVNIFQD